MLNEANILITDDEEINREILRELVENLGHNAIIAHNGNVAIEKLNANKIHAVLLDIQMPEKDGYTVLSEIKSNASYKHIPVIMITAVEENESIVRCLKSGADDYLIKPFEPEILKARLDNALDKLRYILAEKDFLEKTLKGSMKLLTDIISIVKPEAFGRSARIRRFAALISKRLAPAESPTIEIAAMLSQLGSLTLDEELLNKYTNGKPLNKEEAANFAKHPMIAYELIKNLPRLKEIARIIAYQDKRFDGKDGFKLPQDEKIQVFIANAIPIGSRILKAAIDFEIKSAGVTNPHDTIEHMRMHNGIYDPKVLDALEEALLSDIKREVKALNISELEPGMIFVQDVLTASGTRVAAKGQEASYAAIARIRSISKRVTITQPIKVITPFNS